MILGNSGGQNMVQPSGGGGGGLNRLWDIISRNQNLAQITHGVNETTRGIHERNTNATNSLVGLMNLASERHPAVHPEGHPQAGQPHPQAGQLVHPMLAHHISKAGVQSAFGFKFGSQYKPYSNPPVTTTPTPTPTPTPPPAGKIKRKKK